MSVDAVVKALAGLAERSNVDTIGGLSGHFANVLDLGGVRVAIAADGVGTKHILASKPEDFYGVAIDCAAMNANDLICVGARPVAMVDYLAIETADGAEPVATAIAEGFAEAERQGCGGIVGGEVAVLPGIIESRADGLPGLDLAATAIGIVDGPLLDGTTVKAGDVIVGVASSGVHSNGFTLLRALVDESGADLDAAAPWSDDVTLRSELLAPTSLYPRLIESVSGPSLHAAANITGGGITNLARVLGTFGAEITDWPELSGLFDWIAGQVDTVTAFETFNMGVGFMLVIDAEAVEFALSRIPDPFETHVIGTISDGAPAGEIRFEYGGETLKADRRSVKLGQ